MIGKVKKGTVYDMKYRQQNEHLKLVELSL
jgi:hypothetical protein